MVEALGHFLSYFEPLIHRSPFIITTTDSIRPALYVNPTWFPLCRNTILSLKSLCFIPRPDFHSLQIYSRITCLTIMAVVHPTKDGFRVSFTAFLAGFRGVRVFVCLLT
jgi:hypothetical protein